MQGLIFENRNLSDRFTFHIEHKHPRRNQATRDIGSLGARFNWIREAANNILPLIDTFASEHEVPITAPKCLFLGKKLKIRRLQFYLKDKSCRLRTREINQRGQILIAFISALRQYL